MAYEYFSNIASQMGISLGLFIIILLWSVVWKLLAFWKSARKGHIIWFIAFAIVNTLGILEILYIYIFSDMKIKSPKKKITKKKLKKK